jgi:putative transposase
VDIEVSLILDGPSDDEWSTTLLRNSQSFYNASIGLDATIPQQVGFWFCRIGPSCEIDPRRPRYSVGEIWIALCRTLYNMAMKIYKGYKYRLKTNINITQQFVKCAGACRFVWNKLLAINEARYLAGVPRLSYNNAAGLLTWWKQSEEYGFLREVHSQILQQCLKDLERAYTNLYAGRASPPAYRKKFLHDAFRYPQGFAVDGNRVYLPKIGWVRFWKSRPIEGIIKNVTISRSGKHWFIAFQVEIEMPDPVHPALAWVGIDLGIATFAACSDSMLIPPLNVLRTQAKKLARAQQLLARKVKFSQNWQKQQVRIRRLHTRIANCRHDFLHKHSTEISKNHAVVVIENLQVAHMSKSAKGTLEEPGRNVKAKSGLNKAILDQGWGTFRRLLTYKQAWRGGEVITVNPRYTSQRCAACGHVSAKNRVQQALFCCQACGHSYHADVNAAQNILALGQGERLNACSLR